VPGGGDDEYRSVVFDESFVRAARIQEFSARERLDGASRPVRVRHGLPRGLARQVVALVLLIVLAFGFAIYMGVRHPYRADTPAAGEPLRVTVIPLVPRTSVPAVPAASPFAGSMAEHYGAGAEGIVFPDVQQVGGFAQSEVMQALETAKDYLTDSALDPKTVTEGDVGAVRNLLDPGQVEQFDASLSKPAADGTHEATGWLVRFDPAAQVSLVPGGIRVHGDFTTAESSDDQLEITADHTFVYALHGPSDPAVSLFTVRRQLLFRFDHQDIQQRHIEVVQADVAAGPLSCAAAVQSYFRPILAGGRAPGGVTGADPYDRDHPVGAVCAPLDTGAPSAGRSGPAPGPAAGPETTAPAAGPVRAATVPASGPAATRDPGTLLTYPLLHPAPAPAPNPAL
jgi:hypothetical protein